MNTLKDSIKDAQSNHWHWTEVIKEYQEKKMPDIFNQYMEGAITASELQLRVIGLLTVTNNLIASEHEMTYLHSLSVLILTHT